MAKKNLFRKLEDRIRTFAETPFEDEGHPLTIRRKILDEVEDGAERRAKRDAGALPARLVVYVLAADEEAERVLGEAFVEEQRLERDVRLRLQEAGLSMNRPLSVEVRLVRTPLAEWAGIERKGYYLAWAAPEAPAETPAPRGDPAARLVIQKGVAEQEAYTIDARPVVYIGRLAEVVNEFGHVVRHNDVAFLDRDNEVNGTVSREHAYIRYDRESRVYRLFDNDSAGGTSVFREGQAGIIPVKRRGMVLEDGDLIYFGQACARFEKGA